MKVSAAGGPHIVKWAAWHFGHWKFELPYPMDRNTTQGKFLNNRKPLNQVDFEIHWDPITFFHWNYHTMSIMVEIK